MLFYSCKYSVVRFRHNNSLGLVSPLNFDRRDVLLQRVVAPHTRFVTRRKLFTIRGESPSHRIRFISVNKPLTYQHRCTTTDDDCKKNDLSEEGRSARQLRSKNVVKRYLTFGYFSLYILLPDFFTAKKKMAFIINFCDLRSMFDTLVLN